MRLLPDLVLTPEGWQPERAIAITGGPVAAAGGGGARGTRRGGLAGAGAVARHGQQPLPYLPVIAARARRRSRLHGLAGSRALSVLRAAGPRRLRAGGR